MDSSFVTCKLCSKNFTNPCHLECLHDFCRDCIQKELTQSFSSKLSAYSCPVCKQLTATKNKSSDRWAEQLPPSDFVGALAEVHRLKNEDVLCTPCKRKRKSTTGSKWCRSCHEALCKSCVEVHDSLKTTMKHEMMDLNEAKTSDTKSLVYGPNCPIHDHQVLTLFCEDHDELICPLCAGAKHKECKQIRAVNEEVKAKSYEFQEASSKSSNQLQIAKKALVSTQSSLSEVDSTFPNLRDKIRSVRNRVDEILSKCEKKSTEELGRLENEYRGKLEQDIQKLESLNAESSHTNQLLDHVKRFGTDGHILQCMQQVQERSRSNSEAFEDYREVKKLPKVSFAINRQLDEVLRSLSTLGDIVIDGEGLESKKSSPTKNGLKDNNRKSPEKSYPKEHREFSVRTRSDENSCVITGILSLPTLDWLFCDKGNSKLKLFDRHFQMKSEHIMEQSPFDVTLMEDQIIAVTIPESMNILVFKIMAGINLQEEIKTKDRCFGISYTSSENKFVVTCPYGSPASLRLISRNGEELMNLIPEENHGSLFLRPMYVRFDGSGNSLLVSDSQRNRVTAITRSVYRRFHYTHSNMKGPRGLALAANGDLFVVGWGSDSIHRVDDAGRFKEEVLCRHDGICSPQAGCVSCDQSQFALSLDDVSCKSDFILIFSM